MYKYILGVLFILSLFIVISHNLQRKKINTELKIQQVEHPDDEVIDIMLKNKQPTIFLYELELWDGIDLLIGQEYNIIKEVLSDKEAFSQLNYYLQPFNLPFSKNKWDINLIKNSDSWENLSHKPIEEKSYNHLIANFSGLMMVCLFNPSKENLKIINDNPNIKQLLESNNVSSSTIDYIVIPIRPSNMLSIPYGWYYWIYSGSNGSDNDGGNNYCCYLDCYNKLMF